MSEPLVTPETALCMCGMFLHLRGNYTEAMGCYDCALSLAPGCVVVLLKRASLWYEREDTARALGDFDAALKVDGTNPDIFCHRGQLRILQGEIASAISDLREAVRLD